ncbi:hypothetical protein NLJ89_g7003 [Agrocybe chaxingu]|uniref:AMP-dependent synthetase/ligase domain-containing protein n=1 Tax=Agrocybe chaxingu TaxID=84603 RepID=A0A9W8JX71_9AGAR|nr:hypothetical protein NLJ89_g7003 [Agrocybe chaxingu]
MESSPINEHVVIMLLAALKSQVEHIVFRPYLGGDGKWGSISSTTFVQDLLFSQSHYRSVLGDNSSKNIVGLWLTGQKYSDTFNIMGVMLAGFVPQLFSTNFPNEDVIWDLMEKSGANVLIYDEDFKDKVTSCRIPSISVLTDASFTHENTAASAFTPFANGGDTALIVHSSGTTSGMPKLIPVTHSWVTAFIKIKYPAALKQGDFDDANITNTIGNLAHVGSITAYMAALYHGFCTVQSSSMAASTSEIVAMITTCGVNRLALYATFLSSYIKAAQRDPAVTAALASCRQILHTGVSLPEEDEEWAIQNSLRITTMYGTTETAPVMTSQIGTKAIDRLLSLMPGLDAPALIPCQLSSNSDGDTDTKLFEMVARPGKKDSPHPSLFKSPDGIYHTEDVLEEVKPGLYRFRGRKGDWIKTLPGFCDANSIEENVRKTCKDILHDAAVVGENRPLACLFIEALPSAEVGGKNEETLVAEVIARIKEFNQRLFTYERIEDPRRIFVVPHGSLPRTKEKGNIRRNTVASLFKDKIDTAFQD